MLAGPQSLFFPVRANRLLGFLLRYKLHKKNSQINQIKRTMFPLKHLWSGSSGREGFVMSSLADSNSCIKSTDQEGLTLKRILTQNRFSQRKKKKYNKKGLWKVLVFECPAIFSSPQSLHNQQIWREKWDGPSKINPRFTFHKYHYKLLWWLHILWLAQMILVLIKHLLSCMGNIIASWAEHMAPWEFHCWGQWHHISLCIRQATCWSWQCLGCLILRWQLCSVSHMQALETDNVHNHNPFHFPVTYRSQVVFVSVYTMCTIVLLNTHLCSLPQNFQVSEQT